MKAVLLAAPKSGSGKTAVACAFLSALKRRGIKTCAFKCGPDFIDPMYHRQILGIPGANLDLYFLGKERLRQHFLDTVKRHGAEFAAVEGVMGYYDGLSGNTDEASTWAVGRALGLPVILLLDAKGASLTLAAEIRGLMSFREESGIRGVILNRVSEGTARMLSPVLEKETGIPVFGFVPESSEFCFESRHLGLYLPEETEDLSGRMERAAMMLEKTVCIDRILAISETAGLFSELRADSGRQEPPGERVRIAYASDSAFCFHYQENDNLLLSLGAELIPFSPLKDKNLPEEVSGLILSGGYPELFAKELSENVSMRESVRTAVLGGLPLLAECGGFLYLHRELEGADGIFRPMAGVYPGRAFRTGKLNRFGYAAYTSPEGEVVRGHEFHYWESEFPGEDWEAVKPSGRTYRCIREQGACIAGFPHLYYLSNPDFLRGWVKSCRDYAGRNGSGTGRKDELDER